MSVHVLSRFMQESHAELGSRLVGFCMAHAAWDDGICWASQKRLMDETRLSESQVRRCIRNLEQLGEIETRHAQRGRRRINVYRVWCSDVPDYERLPFEINEPFTTTGHPDRQSSETPTTGHLDADDRSSAASTPLTDRKRNVSERKAAVWRVDKQRVTDHEERFARLVLTTWNGQTGQTLTAREWLAMIVRRHREKPELEVAFHADVIRQNLAAPWWKGTAAPNVIYGSTAQFERALSIATAQANGDEQAEFERKRFARILGGRSQ